MQFRQGTRFDNGNGLSTQQGSEDLEFLEDVYVDPGRSEGAVDVSKFASGRSGLVSVAVPTGRLLGKVSGRMQGLAKVIKNITSN